MGRETSIGWCHHTFNPWWGCAKVSDGCKHCYAEAFAKRVGQKVWGAGGERRVFGEKHWNEPRKWNQDAAHARERRRVFCASMADVFEDHPIAKQERPRLWKLIDETPWLDWLLLTKRPENFLKMLPMKQFSSATSWPPPNVWLGVTVEDQEMADKRIPLLLAAPAVVRFLSCEPLLGPVKLHPGILGCRGSLAESYGNPLIHWVIIGGESGNGARPFNLEWAQSLVGQCVEAGAAPFVKQLGALPVLTDVEPTGNFRTHGGRRQFEMKATLLQLVHRKGEDINEFPVALAVREFPEARP